MPKLNSEGGILTAKTAEVKSLFPEDDGSKVEDQPKPRGRNRPTLSGKGLASAQAKRRLFEPDPSKLLSLSEKQDFLRVVLYGDQGVGKTTSAAHLAGRGRVVFVDPENSVRKSALQGQGVEVGNVVLWPDWSYEGLEQLYVTVKSELEREPGSVFAVVLDTVTSLAQFWLEDAVSAALLRPSMQSKHPERTQFDVFQDDYGVLTEQVRSLITRKLYTLNCHVVVLAHSRRGENEDGAVRVGPALSPAAQASLLTYSDWVLRLTRTEDKQGNVTRSYDVSPRGQVEAKDRFGVLPDRPADVSLLDLLESWETQ